MKFWLLLPKLWVTENMWPHMRPQISRGHIFWTVCRIGLIFSEMDSWPIISLCTTFQQNVRDECVKHWLIWQRMPLISNDNANSTNNCIVINDNNTDPKTESSSSILLRFVLLGAIVMIIVPRQSFNDYRGTMIVVLWRTITEVHLQYWYIFLFEAERFIIKFIVCYFTFIKISSFIIVDKLQLYQYNLYTSHFTIINNGMINYFLTVKSQ